MPRLQRKTFDHAILTPQVLLELAEYDDVWLERIERVSWNDFQQVSKLGEGRFSNVFLVVHQEQKRKMALKRIDPNKTHNPQEILTAATDLILEANILSQLDHENIISLRGASSTRFSDSFTKHGPGFFLLMDVLHETLKDRLRRWSIDPSCYQERKFRVKLPFQKMNSGKLDLGSMYQRIDTVAMGIASAMRHLHQRGIILRDLKPGNIGFNEVTGKVCLFDFGFARRLEHCSSDEICGTPNYMAPEVLQAQGYSLTSDVFSFGLVLYEICSLRSSARFKRQEKTWQFSDLQTNAAVLASRPAIQHVPCAYLKHIIEDCWAHDQGVRPTFEKICSALQNCGPYKVAKLRTIAEAKHQSISSRSLATTSTDIMEEDFM
eukprot:scaffold2200_cov112-Cylindrotheca_fusiformis.AAC.1